ncbi:MAG: sigma factor-like helix-turn-helix DNA-binding protein [Gammaproteobacteria bacterium]|nr:sigma factor-like helix-turn-helix DNA-binding protein [Gammaproteobacteria bacterium]
MKQPSFDALPEKYRLPILLAYYADVSYDDIAASLSVSRNHVGVLQSNSHRPALTLLVGLAILFVLVNVPFLDGLVRLLAILLGLGLIMQSRHGTRGDINAP